LEDTTPKEPKKIEKDEKSDEYKRLEMIYKDTTPNIRGNPRQTRIDSEKQRKKLSFMQ